MKLSDLLWFIPGDKTIDKNLLDGQILTRTKQEDVKQHIDIMRKFQEEYNFPVPGKISIEGYAKMLCEHGVFTLLNFGKIDDKYAASIFVPEHLTNAQIETLEGLRTTFEEEFYHVVNLFKIHVYSINMNLTYKLKENCFRDLHIESILEGKENTNGIELLYQEIENQKANTRKIK